MRDRRSWPRLFLLLATCTSAPAASAADAEQTQPIVLRVLFVGNSYIYTHRLPEVVADVAAVRGAALEVGMLAEPNYAIEDHILSGRLQATLAQRWDWVILQQGPSSLPQNRKLLQLWAAQAAAMARAHGTRVALMSAWPALQNAHTWGDAELSYRSAAISNSLCVLPVATAWRIAREHNPTLPLYQSDQLHPQPDGTLLAALTIVRGLLDLPLAAAPASLATVLTDRDFRGAASRAGMLDAFAAEAVAVERPRCAMGK